MNHVLKFNLQEYFTLSPSKLVIFYTISININTIEAKFEEHRKWDQKYLSIAFELKFHILIHKIVYFTMECRLRRISTLNVLSVYDAL